MPIVSTYTFLPDTAASAPCGRARLMCWNIVSRTPANADGVDGGEVLAERSMR